MDSILETAYIYYENRSKLIYSYRGNTFLQGGELFDDDHDRRGRIDCSTLVHLALQGVRYEKSPYVTEDIEGFFDMRCGWYQKDPDAIECLTVRQVLAEFSERENNIRRAYGLARYCREKHLERDIYSGEELKAGDLVFFEAGPSVIEEYRKYGAWMAISHAGIVTEDTRYMINATGSSDHECNAGAFPVRISRIADKGTVVSAARILTWS